MSRDLPELHLPDLARRDFGGSVIAANDEFFADKENLIRPEAPTFRPHTYGSKGQICDGWETRRRRGAGHDWAVVRLGMPGIPRTVVVDTANFIGNYPPHCSVEGTAVDGYPTVEELLATAAWVPLVPRSPLRPDAQHAFAVDQPWRCTHVRLSIYPDGGVARLRVHGEPLPDPRQLAGSPLNLAALANGGRTVACSDSFFSRPDNMLQRGESRFMGDGWETARRRAGGNDWAIIVLAGHCEPTVLEVTTTHYKGNAPERAALSGIDARKADLPVELADSDSWFPLLEPVRLLPDTPHRFRLLDPRPVTHVRLEIYPDGGIGRLRLFGHLTEAGREELTLRWFNALPVAQAAAVLAEAGLDPELIRRRPLIDLPAELGG